MAHELLHPVDRVAAQGVLGEEVPQAVQAAVLNPGLKHQALDCGRQVVGVVRHQQVLRAGQPSELGAQPGRLDGQHLHLAAFATHRDEPRLGRTVDVVAAQRQDLGASQPGTGSEGHDETHGPVGRHRPQPAELLNGHGVRCQVGLGRDPDRLDRVGGRHAELDHPAEQVAHRHQRRAARVGRLVLKAGPPAQHVDELNVGRVDVADDVDEVAHLYLAQLARAGCVAARRDPQRRDL